MLDAEFLASFEDCSLTLEQWDHRAHVKVAYLYLERNSFADALSRIRDGIKKFNAAHDVPDGPLMGYNETTTVAFVHLVAATMAAYAEYCPVASADEFCDQDSQLMSRHILRLFYSPKRRSHPDAKERFIKPDLAELPRIIDQ